MEKDEKVCIKQRKRRITGRKIRDTDRNNGIS